MNTHHLLLMLHLIAATVWIGGHLVLLVTIVPQAIRLNSPEPILSFEAKIEKLGMTSLAILVATGIFMAMDYGVRPSDWFSFDQPIEKVVSLKVSLLILTVLFAVSAQARVIPKLRKDPGSLSPIIFHISAVTFIGLAMLVLGTFVRYGGIR